MPARSRSVSRGRSSPRKRVSSSTAAQGSAAAAGAAEGKKGKGKATPFQTGLWWSLTLGNWVFDFGRPWAMLLVPLKYSPLSLPSVGDLFHMLYNTVVPFVLLQLLASLPTPVPTSLTYLAVILFTMGASMHLVGDSVNHRLVHIGYKLHLSVEENFSESELNVQPRELTDFFKLLYVYDEQLGHLMWYIPFFIVFTAYFYGCFYKAAPSARQVAGEEAAWHVRFVLIPLSALYYWYLVTEGQIFPLFFLAFAAMCAIFVSKRETHRLDANGKFLLQVFALTFGLVAIWVGWLWNDVALRQKYPGLIYVPEPWAWYSLYGAPMH